MSNKNHKNKPVRLDDGFSKELDSISSLRVKLDLEKKTISARELTRMMLNTESWPNMKHELTSKPRRKK